MDQDTINNESKDVVEAKDKAAKTTAIIIPKQDDMDGGDDCIEEVLPEVRLEQQQQQQQSGAVDNATFQSTSVALVDKLLQFSSPRLDSKIVNVLFLEGMMDIFMSHITQLDPKDATLKSLVNDPNDDTEIAHLLESSDFITRLRLSLHTRQRHDLEAMKRSYNAMDILSGTTANNLWVQNAKLQTIVHHLFKVFYPHSHGNLHHFHRIFTHLVRRHPCELLNFVILQNDASILFNYMLPYLYESVVMDSILSLIFVRDINTETKKDRLKSYRKLNELGLVDWLMQTMMMLQQQRGKEEASAYDFYIDSIQEFLIRMLEEASQVDYGDILFLRCLSKREVSDNNIMKLLVDQMALNTKQRTLKMNNVGTARRQRAICILKLFVKAGMLTVKASAMSQPVQGPLYTISLKAQELLTEHIPAICSMLVQDRNTKLYPLTATDIDLLEIIYSILMNATHTNFDDEYVVTPEQIHILASIPSDFWKLLIVSFFEKSSSNIYHTLFYRFIYLVLKIEHEDTIMTLLQDNSLVSRMIDAYEAPSRPENRGFILLLLNQLRLIADYQRHREKSNIVARLLDENDKYQAFLPTLREDTLLQVQGTEKLLKTWKLTACPKPPPHLGPSPPIQQPVTSQYFSPYLMSGATVPLITNDDEDDADVNDVENGIELGSDFAYCLGFKDVPASSNTKNTLTTTMSMSDNNSILVPSLTADEEDVIEEEDEGHGFPMDIIWSNDNNDSYGKEEEEVVDVTQQQSAISPSDRATTPSSTETSTNVSPNNVEVTKSTSTSKSKRRNKKKKKKHYKR